MRRDGNDRRSVLASMKPWPDTTEKPRNSPRMDSGRGGFNEAVGQRHVEPNPPKWLDMYGQLL